MMLNIGWTVYSMAGPFFHGRAIYGFLGMLTTLLTLDWTRGLDGWA